MKLKSAKPYLLLAGLSSLLVVGDKCNADTFVEDSVDTMGSYQSAAPRHFIRDLVETDPQEFSRETQEQMNKLGEALKVYQPEIAVGSFDTSLEQLQQTLDTMIGMIEEVRSDEANARHVRKNCSSGDLASMFASYQKELAPEELDHMVEPYRVTTEAYLSSDARRAATTAATLEAISTGSFTEQEMYTLFSGTLSALPRQTVLDEILEYVPTAQSRLQENFAVQVVNQMPNEQQSRVYDALFESADEPMVDEALHLAANYASQKTKDELVLEILPEVSSKAKRDVLLATTGGVSKDAYQSVKGFFKRVVGGDTYGSN